ncbi:MAG: ABC transporter permease [Cohaesibacteraceae bacterium]|nr:ABC transporter permease [Cohaesibacteraceae bacterium]MBL4875188.1 ABC transporter permease [Cohaesibacteraceae bacterium]
MKKEWPAWFTLRHKAGAWALKIAAYGVLFFLILPIIVIIPLSFNAEPFFSFTNEMLLLKPEAFSLRWYNQIITNPNWLLAIKNSFQIGILAALLATVLGTIAAVGLTSRHMPFKRLIMALMLAPMIVPLIIIAAGMFFFYTKLGLAGSFTGLVIAHATLGIPFVVISVTATLSGFDRSLYHAGLSMGASPIRTFFDVVIPLIRPGVISGSLFAFVTSFDEVVLVLFLAGPGQRTIPRQMFSGLREQINPTILAVATLLIVVSLAFLLSLEFLRRRSARLRGIVE